MEQECQANPELHRMALDLAVRVGTDYMIDMIKAMNPKKLTPAEVDMLRDYLEEE